MAITTGSAFIIQQILQAGQGTFTGSTVLPRIASAVGSSIPVWIPIIANVTVQGTTIGVAGAGAVNGKLFFVGQGGALMIAGLKSAGLTGLSATFLGTAVGNGVWVALNSLAQYVGTSAGVGIGVDVSTIPNANEGALLPILQGNLAGQAILGQNSAQLAQGLARGIADIVKTGIGIGGVTGSPSPIPAVSTSVSLVF
jgi:hypothetical protein